MADLSWAAGVLDLAGNFSAPVRPGDRSYQMRITFRASRQMWTASACAELHRILGGAVSHAATGSGGRLTWTVSGAKACLAVDELVLPYMRLRSRRVQLHAELCRMIRDFKPASFDQRVLPPEELRARYKLRATMLGL